MLTGGIHMDNNINNHNHSMDIYQVEKVEKHQQKLLEQNLTFIEKVAKIETQQTTNTEQLVKLEQQMGSMKDTLIEEIHASVGSFTQLLVQQQDAQNKIIAIQSRQGEQIDEIRKTLDEFTKIQDVVTDHTFRIANLEKQMAKIDELDRAKVTGR
jgi:hypothetical protein